jgi:hypothetical protein
MSLPALLLATALVAVAADRPALIVNAPDTPVRLDKATMLSAAEGPPVVLYAATP